VYFGCHNDRFGGNGSILSIHSDADSKTGPFSFPSSRAVDSKARYCYSIETGLMKDEAIALFQRFYNMENRRAPEEKRKRWAGTMAR
jgi:tRNA-specific adenosine deaminase 2